MVSLKNLCLAHLVYPQKSEQQHISPSKFEPPPKRPNLNSECCRKKEEEFTYRLKRQVCGKSWQVNNSCRCYETLETDNESLTTRAVKKAFPSVNVDKNTSAYTNIRCSLSFENNQSTASFEVDRDSEIHRLQQEIAIHRQKAKTMMDGIMSSVDNAYLRSLSCMYN